jgi:hypothetical protein
METIRQINNATKHKYKCDDLVELESRARMYVTRLTRDCDGTPLYCLGYKKGSTKINGIGEDFIIKAVNKNQ